MANLYRLQQYTVRRSSCSARCCTETKDYVFAVGLLQTYNLAIQMVMTGKSPRSFSVLVSAAYNIVHQMELISYEVIYILTFWSRNFTFKF